MDANEITFGVEIETTIPLGTIPVGPHGRGEPVAGLPGWLADSDPSIRCGRDRQVCEFVSPVYRGADGLRQLLADLAVIRGLGARVNGSCGLHVHVGFDRQNAAATERLVTLAANFETAIFAATGTKNRERGRWCRGLQRDGSAAAALRAAEYDRYRALNLATRKPTVEFRAFAGTLNADKIVGYVRLCVGMAERAIAAKRVTTWTAPAVSPTSPVRRAGDGQTALARLYYQLGWTKGRQPFTFGALVGDGLSPIVASKRTLMGMARKYDGQP